MAGGHAFAEREGRTLIHLNRVGFRVDGAAGSHDPRGMAASQPVGRSAHRRRRRGAGPQPDAGGRALLSQRAGARSPRPMPARWPRRARRSAASASPASISAAARRRSRPSPMGISSTPRPCRSAGTTSRWISPRPCRRHLRRLSESRRYMARWSSPSPTSTRPSPMPWRARRKGRAGRRRRRSLAGIIRPRVAGILGMVRERIGQGRRYCALPASVWC